MVGSLGGCPRVWSALRSVYDSGRALQDKGIPGPVDAPGRTLLGVEHHVWCGGWGGSYQPWKGIMWDKAQDPLFHVPQGTFLIP